MQMGCMTFVFAAICGEGERVKVLCLQASAVVRVPYAA